MKTLLHLGLLSALAFSGFSSSIAFADSVLFEEKFPYSGQFSQDVELREFPPTAQGPRYRDWCGGNAGDVICGNTPGEVNSGACINNNGGEGAVSSSSDGQDGTPGFAVWSQKGISADGFLYTEKFQIQASQLTRVEWLQADSSSEGDELDAAHLFFRIGETYYISDQSFTTPPTSFPDPDWTSQSVNIADLTFFTRQVGQCAANASVPALPDGGVGPGGSSLPAGTVSAFGFWFDGPKNGNSRFDDVRLIGVAAPEPVPALSPTALFGLFAAIAVLGGWRLRSRNA